MAYEVIATHDNLPRRQRPRSEWFEKTEAKLTEMLPPKVRQKAAAAIVAFLDHGATEAKGEPRVSTRVSSEYVLSGIIRSKQGGYRLTGGRNGTGAYRRRYYGIEGASTGGLAKPRSPLRKLIPAEAIESAAISAIGDALSNSTMVCQGIELYLRQKKTAPKAKTTLSRLRSEQSQLRTKLDALFDLAGEEHQDVLKAKIQEVQSQLARNREQMVELEAEDSTKGAPVAAQFLAVAQRLKMLAKATPKADPEVVRNFLDHCIEELVIDLVTREFELLVGLPTDIATHAKPDEMCVDAHLYHRKSANTHLKRTVILAKIRGWQRNLQAPFEYDVVSRSPYWQRDTESSDRAASV